MSSSNLVIVAHKIIFMFIVTLFHCIYAEQSFLPVYMTNSPYKGYMYNKYYGTKKILGGGPNPTNLPIDQ